MRSLLGVLCFVAAVVVALVLHARIIRVAGRRRSLQAVAFIVAGLCCGVGLGAFAGLVNDGWVRNRITREWGQLSLPLALERCAIVGALLGLLMFVVSVLRDAFTFPADEIATVLADEPRLPAKKRAAKARHLLHRARMRGASLPPELEAYVERNHQPRRRR